MFKHLREDIYFCYGCGQFHQEDSDETIDIPYTEMPADFALHVMEVRQLLANGGRKRKRKRFYDL